METASISNAGGNTEFGGGGIVPAHPAIELVIWIVEMRTKVELDIFGHVVPVETHPEDLSPNILIEKLEEYRLLELALLTLRT